jgi:S1-C subfamily serine protease/HEAT repeat protein
MVLVVGGILGFLGLLVLLGGGFAFYLLAYRSSGPMPPMAKTIPDAPVEDQAAVAPPAPGPAPANPLAVQPPQPHKPPAPPKEPIQPVQKGERGALPLKELKAASVYIKAMTATMGATGSGFVIRAQGDTVYVVTNHHVVVPSKEDAGPPHMVPLPPIGPRRPVLPPIGPRRPRRGIAALLPPGQQAAELTVVFYSGTAKEQSLRAEIVGLGAGADLAALKVAGVQDAPRPIDGARTPELVETMPVLAFGFPFGEKLDPGKRNPAVTVTKGAVSSLRGNRGELEEVQLDLDLNPGNSGGPVVDEKGALIGVAVAKVSNTRIGFAVPLSKLNRLLQGRIDPPAIIQSLTIQGRTQVRILAPAADPLGKLRAPTLLYGPANELQQPRQGPQGWEKVAGAKSSALTIRGTEAAATLALTPPANGDLKVLAQVSYQTDSGQTVYGEPRTLSLGSGSAPRPSGGPNTPVEPPIVAARPSGPPKGEELTKLLADLKSADEATRQRAASTLQQAPPRQRRDEVQRGLRELLGASDAATRMAGVQALAACDPKEAAPALAKLLEDEVPSVRHTVLRAMKDSKDPRVAEAVAARLPIEPLPAMDVLKAIGPAAEKAVLPYLAEKYAGPTRFWTFNIVKEIGTAASLPALEAVQGTDKVHVGGVLEAVRQRIPLTADEWPGALDDLKSADAARRTKATRRIAATPPIEERRADVVSRLEGLLNDQSGDVRIAAVKSLAHWGGQKSVPILATRLEGFDPGFHAAVIDVLAELKGDEAAAAIAKRLPDVHDRGKATQALKAMDPLDAEKAILPLLSETNVFVRCEAIKVLTDVGGRDSVGPLEKLASDNNVFYSGLAKQALEAIKDRSEAK